MKARKGFVGTILAVVGGMLAIALAAISMSYSSQSVNTEAWLSKRNRASLYPLALSAANFVLGTIQEGIDVSNGTYLDLASSANKARNFVSNDANHTLYNKTISISVPTNSENVSLDIELYGEPNINKLDIRVKVYAHLGGTRERIVRGQLVSNDDTGGKPGIIWR